MITRAPSALPKSDLSDFSPAPSKEQLLPLQERYRVANSWALSLVSILAVTQGLVSSNPLESQYLDSRNPTLPGTLPHADAPGPRPLQHAANRAGRQVATYSCQAQSLSYVHWHLAPAQAQLISSYRDAKNLAES